MKKKVSVSRDVYYVNSQGNSPLWYEYGQTGRRNVVLGKVPNLQRVFQIPDPQVPGIAAREKKPPP